MKEINLRAILREKEIVILKDSEKKDYLDKLTKTLKAATKEWFDKKYEDAEKEMPYDWYEFNFKKAPLKTILSYISGLNSAIEFLKYDGGILEEVHIDKDSGFPTWAEVNRIYQMPDNSPFMFECNEKKLENELNKIARIIAEKLPTKEAIDLDMEDYRMVKYYKDILSERKIFPKMRALALEDKPKIKILVLEKNIKLEKYDASLFSSFDYSIINNCPFTLSLNISTMFNPKIESLKKYKGKKGARLFKKNKGVKKEISSEFKSFLEENMHFDSEYIEYRLKEIYPDLDIRIKKMIFGPFYYSKDQNFDALKTIIPDFALEKLFELEEDPFPFLVLQEDSKGYQSWKNSDTLFKGVMFYSASYKVKTYLENLEKRTGKL